jgi:asparagine synthase (glutamine-hydrolysing)
VCGILGVAGPRHGELAEDAGLYRSLAHRGPDGEGVVVRDGVALAHTRLSIIDLANGAQPMETSDGKLAITFNGEIYNYRELRHSLEQAGHCFNTDSDTEVLLNAYQEWGKHCLQRLRGMFSFGIVDYEKRNLFLARDPLGIKPLVYSYAGGHFSFASEIQGLCVLPWVKPHLSADLQGVYELLRFAYTAAPRTAYNEIHRLPPGHWLELGFSEQSKRRAAVRYWAMEHNPDESLNSSDCLALVDSTIRESVKAHLVSDVPFGAFLSGGLDSTLVVSYMSELLDEQVRTFSIGFDKASYDERSYARLAAKTLGTKHYEEVLTGDALELLPKLVRHYGEPFGDSSAVPTWHVARLARKQVPMVLSGDGGDEFFGGYASYRSWLAQLDPNHRNAQHPRWMVLARSVLSRLMPRRYPPKPDLPEAPLDRWINIVAFYKEHQIKPLLTEDFRTAIHRQPQQMFEAYQSTCKQPPLTQARTIDINSYLPSDILTKVDIASMMHGLEVRTPLTDIRVAELSGRIPWQRLMDNREGPMGWTGKLPIRGILANRFNDEFIDRPKQGFGIPVNDWLFSERRTSRRLRNRLLSPGARIHNWLRPSGIRSILDQKLGYQTWHLMVFQEWLDQNGF